jgi:hypothetical protein
MTVLVSTLNLMKVTCQFVVEQVMFENCLNRLCAEIALVSCRVHRS